ncbi:hypothetical protein [Solwaraspora sp. WMMD792]|uniref:hypothetical protein n=1 Tax=Solwaraspora sp. WMMD792 TaxID=3016099 RepID=UPI0024179C2C|nr:hypothetical protein [Solwaraspora sp. WMMD792]MDG4774311.1 hypothetical protein [Solwaraspora sp. WMMD792]
MTQAAGGYTIPPAVPPTPWRESPPTPWHQPPAPPEPVVPPEPSPAYGQWARSTPAPAAGRVYGARRPDSDTPGPGLVGAPGVPSPAGAPGVPSQPGAANRPAADPTMGLPMGAPGGMSGAPGGVVFNPAVENSGSLTGHILAQGWADLPEREDRSTTKVVLAMVVGLAVMVVIGIVAVLAVGNTFTDIFDGLLGG